MNTGDVTESLSNLSLDDARQLLAEILRTLSSITSDQWADRVAVDHDDDDDVDDRSDAKAWSAWAAREWI